MPRVSERYSAARRDQILSAARRCFARNGFHGTSMQQICVLAGLSPGAVYGYFPSKDDLVLAIASAVIDQVVPQIEAATRSRPLPPLSETLGQVVATIVGADDARDLARLAVQVWALAQADAALATRLARAYRSVHLRLSALVAAYQQQGDLDTGTPARDIARVLTMLGPAFLLDQVLLGRGTSERFTGALHALIGRPQTAGGYRDARSTRAVHRTTAQHG